MEKRILEALYFAFIAMSIARLFFFVKQKTKKMSEFSYLANACGQPKARVSDTRRNI
jgi:hypothetical protein